MCIVTAAESLMEDLCYLGQLSVVNFYFERVINRGNAENELMVTKGERWEGG